jgi:hypothetical protein
LTGGSSNIALNVIGNLKCLFVFLRPVRVFTREIKLNFWSKVCHFLKKNVKVHSRWIFLVKVKLFNFFGSAIFTSIIF